MLTSSPASALAPFRVRSFRFLWPAELATSWALEMEALILGWYVLVETGSVLLLVLFGALIYFGMLVSPLFGLLGDRIGHRNLLCATRAVSVALAAVLMVLIFLGLLAPVHVFIVTAFASMTRSSDLVMRYAVTGAIMPPGLLMGAMGVSRATVDSARVAGALAGAGIVTAFGMGLAYVAITCLYALSLLLTLGVADERPKHAAHAGTAPAATAIAPGLSAWRELGHAFAYVWTRPALLAAMSVAFLINLTAYPFFMGLLPYVAKNIYGVGQTGLGYLVAGWALGSLIGSIVVSASRVAARAARVMILSTAIWYVLLLLFAHVTSLPAGIAVLILAGIAQSLCVTPLAVVMLRSSSAQFRGRVMGLRMFAIYGLPIGLVASGPIIERLGFVTTTTLYAASGLLLLILIAFRWRAAVWRLDAAANAR